MRRLFASALAGAVVAGTFLAATGTAFATDTEPSATPTCSADTPIGPTGISVTNPASSPASTSGTDQVCIEPGGAVPWPITGTITASGSAQSASGYVVADGNPSNPGALSGYIGVEGSGSGVSVVGCSSGNYDPSEATNGDSDADDNVIWSSSDPTSGIPPSTSGPCAVQPPSAP
jgi:hypothetical protein